MRLRFEVLPLLYFLVSCTTTGNAATPLNRSVYRQCTFEASGCDVQVELKCTYEDSAGVRRSCLRPNGEYSDDDTENPFITIDSDECQNGSGPSIDVTLEYRICNDNDFDMTLSNSDNYIRYRGDSVQGSVWDNNLDANTCRRESVLTTFDVCSTSRSMAIQMVGNLIGKNGNTYCRCFLRRAIRSTIENSGPTPTATPTISKSPTRFPRASPTGYPTNRPTRRPVRRPSRNPTSSPTRNPTIYPNCRNNDSYVFGMFEFNGEINKRNCEWITKNRNKVDQRRRNWCGKYIEGRYVRNACPVSCENCGNTQEPPEKFCDFESDAVITEITDPLDNNYGKYIELYFHKCGGKVISSNLKLLHWRAGNSSPSRAFVNLKGVQIRDDGFVTVCGYSNTNTVYDGREVCTLNGTAENPVVIRGTDSIALAMGTYSKNRIIDVFGNPGSSGNLAQRFTDGRAVRNINAITPSENWDEDEWIVFPGEGDQVVGIEGMDPNEWKYVRPELKSQLIITEIIDPSDGEEDAVPRFVELYAPRGRDRGMGTKDDFKLVVFHSDFENPDFRTAIYINYIPESGFITVCNPTAVSTLGVEKCAIVSDKIGGPANSNGNDQIAIISGDENNYFVVDIFGVIGEDGTDTDHDFLDSRVVRNRDVTRPQAVWSKDDWTIESAAFYTGDPNEWEDSDTQRNAPSSSPSSPPTLEDQDCNLILTELTNPLDNPNAGYIELYSDCPRTPVHGSIKVITWRLGGVAELSLQGFIIPDDGFIIICKDRNTHRNAYNYLAKDYVHGEIPKSICDIEEPDLVSDGGNPVAIIEGEVEDERYIDNYGFPGASLYGTQSSFRDGRVVRNHDVVRPVGYFDPSMWKINPPDKENALVTDVDPRDWVDIPLELFFTELCDPSAGYRGRFIELYSPNKRNFVIRENIIVIKYEVGSMEPVSYETLRGKKINNDGFLVLCTSYFEWEDKCDYVLGDHSVADSDGQSLFKLSRCAYPDAYRCEDIDVYGFIGQYADNTEHDYEDGRAVKLKNPFVTASERFEPDEWYVHQGQNNKYSSDSSQCDPGEWNYTRRDEDDDKDKDNKDKDNKDKYKDKNK